MGQFWLIYRLIKFEKVLKFLKIFYDISLRETKSVIFPDKMLIIQYYDYEWLK